MVQFLHTPQKPLSTGQKLSNAVGVGLQGANQLMMARDQQKAIQQENEAAKRMGIDLSGISDPDTRKKAFEYAMQGENQRKLEQQKMAGRQGLQQEKQDYLSKLFGGGQQGGQNGQQQPGQQQGQQFDPALIPDEAIARATAIDPALGRTLQQQKDVALRERTENRKIESKKDEMRRKEETSVSHPILLELNQARKNIPLQEQAIEDIKTSIPEVGSLDYLAELTGFEPFRTAAGAKTKTAIKDFFLSDLSRAGARPNQWIEQQLADALPKIGRDPIANLVVAEGMRFKVDLAKKRIELIDELSEKDKNKYGYVRGDIDSRAYNLMKPYVEQRKKDLQEDIKKVKSSPAEKQSVRMVSPEGDVYEILPEDVEEAELHEFTFG